MEKKQMISNMEIFCNFLADNFCLTEYILAYTRRYNICNNPFYSRVKAKAESNPKGIFKDILGSNHKFKKLEKKWLEYVDNSINYVPKHGDYIYCAFFDEDNCCVKEWVAHFDKGTKEEFVTTDNFLSTEQTFVRKATENERSNYIIKDYNL